MATHYRKLHSAKAAVDTSAPKSLSSSVKFRDQQNKERLLKAVQKFKNELQQICSTSNHHTKSHLPEQCKEHYGHREIPVAKTEKLSDIQKTTSRAHSPILIARDVMRSIEYGSRCYGDMKMAPSRPQTGRISLSHGLPRKKTYKDPQRQTYSGDVLDKHAASFTSFKMPFKPRLLKKPAHSYLSKYRYYTAPTKKNITKALSSKVDKPHRSHLTQLHRSQEDIYLPLENFSHTPQSRTENPAALEIGRSHLQWAEDQKYLHFLEKLTSDLTLKGYGSSSAMENVFQDHLKRKQQSIDEVKKKILVQELKDELERSVKLDFSISYDGSLYGSQTIPLHGHLSRLLNG
ncbi:spermatogenesis-associated protein 7-like isoform X1 [Mixophyes fleayi]|uniref:spermatogenesis-associated protein 7-like isoform X1 n=1 Tax=Mixophyes fleayi TaxID=3061075 RepID=UPI003F4D775B